MEKLVSMIKQRVYFFSTPVIIGEARDMSCRSTGVLASGPIKELALRRQRGQPP